MAWQCSKCQTVYEGEFCPKCGLKHIAEYGRGGFSYTDQSTANLVQSVEKLKNLCYILIFVIIIMAALFGFAYYSVWENVNDLWDNADLLWESSERLWNESYYNCYDYYDYYDYYYYR